MTPEQKAQIEARSTSHFELCGSKSSDPEQIDIRELLKYVKELEKGPYQCPDCKCTFIKPFKCITCGAEKLYDATVRSLGNQVKLLEAALDWAIYDKTFESCSPDIVSVLEASHKRIKGETK